MTRRTLIKWLHWLAFALMLWFLFVEPDVPLKNRPPPPGGALALHAGIGLMLALVALVWTVLHLRHGLAGRPGPKLPGWGRRAHRIFHVGLACLVPVTVLSGAVAGLASVRPIHAFGVVPINPTGWGTATVHEIAKELHEIVFDTTMIVIILHAGFHIWRDVKLRDNALRIMFPKLLHRYL